MANTPKKVAVIGLDCALPHLIEKHIKDGQLPTFKKLIESGVIAENCLVPYPTITPPNWASIATGAWPGTHNVTDFHYHEQGTTPENANTFQSFGSQRLKAETIWDAADKAGKKCIVLNYPGSWPSNLKNGIMVGGSGLSVGENRDGQPGMGPRVTLCNDQLITTGIYPRAIKGVFKPAPKWANLPEDKEDPLEIEAKINFRGAEVKPPEATWYLLAQQSKGDGYDKITLATGRDMKKALCTLSPGQWSPTIYTEITMADGKQQQVFFRCKLIELSDDTENLRFYISPMGTTSGWSNPPEIASEIKSQEGILLPGGGILGYVVEWFDLDTFVEVNDFYTQWLADAASAMLSKHEWDAFFMHAHSPDWAYHVILTDMDPNLTKDENKRNAAWDAHLKIYQSQDRMIAQILQACDKDTLIIMVSDHGAVADGLNFDPYKILEPLGLAALEKEQQSIVPVTSRGEGLQEDARVHYLKADAKKSKCFPQRTMHLYINLKGRDPEGIVEPEDYTKIQQQIIDAMLTYVDPNNGQRPVSLALSRQDARILGLYGDHVGDVIYAIYPWYSGQHGNILPAAEWGIGSLKALMTFTGPGIKKGYRLERTTNIIDIVPTICYLLDFPIPAQTEGAVIYQTLKDPDLKSKEIEKLKSGLARMETALQRGERQPWDKHECA